MKKENEGVYHDGKFYKKLSERVFISSDVFEKPVQKSMFETVRKYGFSVSLMVDGSPRFISEIYGKNIAEVLEKVIDHCKVPLESIYSIVPIMSGDRHIYREFSPDDTSISDTGNFDSDRSFVFSPDELSDFCNYVNYNGELSESVLKLYEFILSCLTVANGKGKVHVVIEK